jgi:peptidoglycan/xylan/chitin deacetylase (PgdA/CDA1 family)
MYHDLGTGVVRGKPVEASHISYVVSGAQFAKQLNYLRSAGWNGCKVSEALQGKERAVALTFDDGYTTDIELAAPALSYAGFTATFYVVTSWVGTPGYLSVSELRSLARLGCEIGSHTRSHPYLPSLSMEDLRRELRESKDQLEQWVGAPVEHFSCPMGGHTAAVSNVAEEAGYVSVATSQIGVNTAGTKLLKRIAVRRTTSVSSYGRICAGRSLFYPRARQAVLASVRSAIGISAYSILCKLSPHSQTPSDEAARRAG